MAGALAGGAVGAIIGAAVTLVLGQRSLRAAHVLAERRKWRVKIRALAGRLARSPGATSTDALWRRLALNLNPLDPDDRKLLALARLRSRAPSQQDELTERFALLLKHDWDRAKIEASWFPFFVRWRTRRHPTTAERQEANRAASSPAATVKPAVPAVARDTPSAEGAVSAPA